MRRSLDVVALIMGVLLTGVAVASLWHTFVGALDWHLIKLAAPFALVVIGVAGLALSRRS